MTLSPVVYAKVIIDTMMGNNKGNYVGGQLSCSLHKLEEAGGGEGQVVVNISRCAHQLELWLDQLNHLLSSTGPHSF